MLPNLNARVRNLAGLSIPEAMPLVAQGVTTANNLAGLGINNIKHAAPALNVVKTRKLKNIGNFIARGNQLTANTTMDKIVAALNAPQVIPGLLNV